MMGVSRGIIIPLVSRDSWFGDDASPDGPRWQGAVIRRQATNPNDPLPLGSNGKPGARYLGVKGTTRSELYPFPNIDPTELPAPGLVCEGEVDALTLWQEAGHLGIVATLGGAGGTPSDFALAQLGQCDRLLIATDRDKRGRCAYLAWQERFPGKTMRALLPADCKDVNTLHQNGGNVREWIAAELRRFGWSPKPGDAFEPPQR